jgi:uncharacterized protein (DUF1778 family)
MKSEEIKFRAERDNVAQFVAAAKAKGLSLSAWIRMVALEAAQQAQRTEGS